MNMTNPLTKEIPVGATIDGLELDRDSDRELWVLLLIRGIATFVFGFAAVIWPGITLVLLAYFFSAYLLINGMIDVVNGIRMVSTKNPWFLKVVFGIVQFSVALYLLRSNFVITTVVFLQTIGLVLLLQAVVDGVLALKGSTPKGQRALLGFSALLSFIIGLALLQSPATSGLIYVWIIGFYGILGGAIMVASAFSVRPSKT